MNLPHSSAHQTASTTPQATVTEQLCSLVTEWGHCDLIIDRETSNPLSEELELLMNAENDDGAVQGPQVPILPINPLKAALEPDECLLLARLSLQQLPLLERSMEISLEQNVQVDQPVRSIGGWVFSRQADAQKIAEHIEKIQIVRVQNAPRAVLRFWDPRVIGHLPAILKPAQLSTLMGPIERWVWVNRSGQLQVLEKPAITKSIFDRQDELFLSAEQDAAIERIAHINRLLSALAQLGHHPEPALDPELQKLLQCGQSKGHVTEADLLAYGLHAVHVSPNFDALLEVQQAIHQAHAQDLGLCDALEPFDDEFWATHAAQLIELKNTRN
jgi:Domain of unknown function (DUF4123)